MQIQNYEFIKLMESPSMTILSHNCRLVSVVILTKIGLTPQLVRPGHTPKGEDPQEDG